MSNLVYADKAFYDRLKKEFGCATFKGGMDFDAYFKKYFDIAPYPHNPGWKEVDEEAYEHACNFCADDID